MTWFLTSFAVGDEYVLELRGMMESFRKHHPIHGAIVEENPIPLDEWGKITCYKPTWLRQVWSEWSHLGDMVWVDADARFRRPITPPDGDFIVGAKDYVTDKKVNPERISTGTLWLKPGCEALLEKWEELSVDAVNDEESFTAALRSLGMKHFELPDEMTSPCSSIVDNYRGSLWRDSDIVHWNMSRKVVGPLRDWPPPEDERP